MDIDDLAISLLSFGETGMELISAQDVKSIDMDHIQMIGNFYSNVLGAAEESTGLFGPLPIAYRFDLLLFLYAFNAFDSSLKDERVIRRNHMTRSCLLIFFNTTMDLVFSNQRKAIRKLIDAWAISYLSKEIRNVKLNDLNELKEQILSQISSYLIKTDFNDNDMIKLVKMTGKNFFLLDTVSKLMNKSVILKFFTNSDKIEPIIKRSIFLENIDSLKEYKKYKNNITYNFDKFSIFETKLYDNEINSFNITKNFVSGIFYFFDMNTKAANFEFFLQSVEQILNSSTKNSVISFCILMNENSSFSLENSSIPYLIANQKEKSINLVNINQKDNSLEIALLNFVEKIISNLN